MTTHPTHPEVIKRLKRAQGHLNSILTMLEEDRGCLEIAQQLQAVEKAISSAKKNWCTIILITASKTLFEKVLVAGITPFASSRKLPSTFRDYNLSALRERLFWPALCYAIFLLKQLWGC